MAWRHHRRIAQGACDQAAARQVNQHGLALPAHIDVSVVDGWSDRLGGGSASWPAA
jgi:hypothetical protein